MGLNQFQIAKLAGSAPVKFNGAPVAAPDINDTTPAAEPGFANVKVQKSGSSVSLEYPVGGLPSQVDGGTF